MSEKINKKRIVLATALNAGICTSSTIALATVWYSEFEKTPFHTFNDSKEWMQMDKAGHLYASYHFTELASKTYRWTGLNAKKSALLGSAFAWGYQLSFEMLDGYSSGWGFSWSDVTANTLGAGMFVAQEYAFKKQMFKLKFSYMDSKVADFRPNVLGSNFQEQLLKDYNSQTYWLTFSPFAFSKKSSSFPKWINLALGYGVHDKLVGDKDIYTTPDGLQTFHAKREFILSLDINVKELKVKSKIIKAILSPFNSIKIPFPAVIWRGNVCYGKLLY